VAEISTVDLDPSAFWQGWLLTIAGHQLIMPQRKHREKLKNKKVEGTCLKTAIIREE